MHGAGNSFVITEGDEAGSGNYPETARSLCGGVYDGFIVVCPYEGDDADFRMLFYNSDGTLGEMCGNGARCVARYGFEHGYAPDPDNIRIMTTAGLVTGRRITGELYRVRLNDPSVLIKDCTASVPGGEEKCSYTELGNPGIPHAVVKCTQEELSDTEALRQRGRNLRYSETFPKGANVTFAVPLGGNTIKAVTYERGVEDFTLACGTGSGATAISCSAWELIDGSTADIDMPGGRLRIEFSRDGDTFSDIYLTGPTAYITE